MTIAASPMQNSMRYSKSNSPLGLREGPDPAVGECARLASATRPRARRTASTSHAGRRGLRSPSTSTRPIVGIDGSLYQKLCGCQASKKLLRAAASAQDVVPCQASEEAWTASGKLGPGEARACAAERDARERSEPEGGSEARQRRAGAQFGGGAPRGQN